MPSSLSTKASILRVSTSTASVFKDSRSLALVPPSAIVEQVRDGTQMRVRLMLDEHNHQFINLVRLGLSSGLSR